VAYTSNAQIRNGALDGMSKADSVITFTNHGSRSCWTRGYPGVAALDAAGHQLKQAVRGAAATGQTPLITLAPGQVASAEITGNTASCAKLTKIAAFLVTAPDQRTSVRLAGSHLMCLNSLGVDPLQRGDAGGLPL
jgi:sarcosine oxidase gamma subunit